MKKEIVEKVGSFNIGENTRSLFFGGCAFTYNGEFNLINGRSRFILNYPCAGKWGVFLVKEFFGKNVDINRIVIEKENSRMDNYSINSLCKKISIINNKLCFCDQLIYDELTKVKAKNPENFAKNKKYKLFLDSFCVAEREKISKSLYDNKCFILYNIKNGEYKATYVATNEGNISIILDRFSDLERDYMAPQNIDPDYQVDPAYQAVIPITYQIVVPTDR